MTHWGWYWKIKKKHTPKALCSWSSFVEIDSFDSFKDMEGVEWVRKSESRIFLEIPRYKLVARLMDDYNLSVVYDGGSYIIPVEKKPCNYGGFYHFFHCPACDARMRKLYCIEGKYLCRKCAHLGYYSQRLRPSERCARMSRKVKEFLKSRAGSLKRKPPWMKKATFQKLRIKYVKYDEKYVNELTKELRAWYGSRIEPYIEDHYDPPSGMDDAYVEREKTRQIS